MKDPPSILQRAVMALARREHSRAELARKLRRYLAEDSDPREIDAVLDQLQAKGMLSDERFAASLVRTRGQRYGTARVRSELKQHALADEVIQRSIGALRDSEFERAHAAWLRKFGTPAADEKQRARQMRYLAARGFAIDVILRIVQGRAKGW